MNENLQQAFHKVNGVERGALEVSRVILEVYSVYW